MKGGYTILDIKKCEFALNAGETEYVTNNTYAKNIVNAVWNGQKSVLVENLAALGSSYTSYKGSGFCKMLTSTDNYICLELPDSGQTSIFFNSDGTITIDN